MIPSATIEAFDSWLTQRLLRFEAVVIGGSALALLGVTTRQTRDFDILAPAVPADIAKEARDLAGTCVRRASKTKLFALCDRGTDLADCVALAPTERLGHGL
jgi:hypothetical protein